MVGLTRIELVTSSLSGMRSNRLSYSPLTGLSLYLWVGSASTVRATTSSSSTVTLIPPTNSVIRLKTTAAKTHIPVPPTMAKSPKRALDWKSSPPLNENESQPNEAKNDSRFLMVPVAEPTFHSKTPVMRRTTYNAAWNTAATLNTLHTSRSRMTRVTLRTRWRGAGVEAFVGTFEA